ncbi:unnamed protein product [Darwinula stevensoni]|uniref:Prolyl endopeptidase n=1 Tax=Darwinula stevensoni TaxID=69355 RepID=A0A7R9A981_9CRUS|nr:unnamed protein product [Darwinula stevensoni]CAG0896968.1 unnamed protein product [Darwinula stevensoni]
MLLDPNTFSKDGTSSLGELSISKDGNYMAFTISTGGSDWRNIVVQDLKTNQMLTDTIRWAKFTGIAWEKDGFYYSRFPEPAKGDELSASNQFGAIYYHKLGIPQSADPLIFADRSHPNRFFSAETSEDEKYLLLSASETTSGNMLYCKDLSKPGASFVPISDNFDSDFNFIDNVEGKLLFMTNKKAPNRRLISVSAAQPEEEYWENIIPENSDDVLQSASLCGGKIVCQYLHNASSSLKVFSLDGKLEKEVSLPEIGTVGGVSGNKDDKTAFFSFQSFLRPNTIYSLDMGTFDVKPFKAPKIAFNPDSFETEQIWYPSKDGTKIPMFVTRKKKVAMDGSNPTLLYGYGGFNISVTPSFSASRATLLENNGIYVVANIRGGGEFGEKWHKAGTKCQKQNVFDDFIGAAEYLIAKGYTKPENLAIQGGSNGGLLVGACMTQRPELFGVCFPQVGVLDMLRYHKFTIGRAWSVDYGLSENKDEFECLLRYSPLHNVEKIAYPATMVTTADHDDRVVPAHSFKFAAALQAHQTAKNPTLIRIETSAGHGAGKPTKKLLEEAADMLSFMLYNMKKRVIY